MSNKIPIWLSDWTFKDSKGYTIIVRDVFIKGESDNQFINNPMLVKKALSKYGKVKKSQTYKPINVVLKSQHGYGPRYEDEKLFTK